MIKDKIGILGVGNMGSAILEGLFIKKLARPDQVWVFDKIQDKSSLFSKQWKTHLAASAGEVIENTNVILLAIKPQDLNSLSKEIKSQLKSDHTIISILAGTPLTKIQGVFGSSVKLVRAMPNLGARVGMAITALTGKDAQSVEIAEAIFSGCGKTMQLEERFFDLVTALSGSGPAYFFFVMELLVNMAVKNGMNEKDARRLAVQTALGSGLLASKSEYSPKELRKMVTSKGGTTEAALNVLNQNKFDAIFYEALQAALDRGKQLSQ